jgi:hypothetical protein
MMTLDAFNTLILSDGEQDAEGAKWPELCTSLRMPPPDWRNSGDAPAYSLRHDPSLTVARQAEEDASS